MARGGVSGKARGRGRRCREDVPSAGALREVPGVGPSIAGDLRALGIETVEDLRGADPEELYTRHCLQKGAAVDRCWLYVARCAVYYAGRKRHDPEKLKWWNWKDGR
jgi:hypothetical protein